MRDKAGLLARAGARRIVAVAVAQSHAAVPGVAQEQGCDLIVMGAHGSEEADTRYLGSVARYVLASSPVPVLILRDPREAMPPEYRDEPPRGAGLEG